ncbi:hypothetical protein LguiA_032159 [Lonicera macranthoides]
MEEERYWMWPKPKSSSLSSQIVASTSPLYGPSWEEQAFAKDASGPLGGCIWPPRSYSCSFCRREFRSAQALGGHMNVHRRDRARLKQSPCPNNEILHHNSDNHSTSPSNSSQLCTFVYNPNSDLDPGFLASPSSPSRVLVKPSQLNCDEKAFLPLFSTPIVEEKNKRGAFGNRNYHFLDLKKEEKNSKILEHSSTKVSKGDDNYIKADLSMSLDLFVCRPDKKEDAMSCKRRRTDSTSSFFPKQNSKVIEIGSNSIEGLDLELRLGERPKVK